MNFDEIKNLNFSVFGAKNKINGEFHLHGDVIISSQIEGQINMLDEGKITVEREGSIEGILYCHDLEVFGTIKGHIKASGQVTIRSSAEISGNLQAERLSIFPGAILNIEGHTSEL
jgi:cytoskeletal protein CcmA (bactofilin family)